MISEKIYLACDESNNGRYPGIWVGVFSKDINDIRPSPSAPLEKLRHNEDITAYLGPRRMFKYFAFQKERSKEKQIEYKRFGLIALTEFIQLFPEGDLELVIQDGVISERDRVLLRKFMHPKTLPEVKAESKADQTYPLVNMADHIANMLYRKYNANASREIKRFESNLLKPDMDKYRFLLNG